MTASELGRKLVEHDGISNPDARTQRRQQMEAVLENERAFARKLQWVAMAAWGTTLLILVAGMLVVSFPVGNDGVYIAFMFVGLVGGLAFVLAILATAAWLFRSRATTMAAIEMRLAGLEDLIERAGEERGER